MYRLWFIILAIFLLNANCLAQIDSVHIKPQYPNSIEDKFNSENSQKTQLFYLKVERFFQKKKILTPLYAWLFVSPANTDTTQSINNFVLKTDSLSFHNGKVIRNISFQQLNVFGRSVHDTTQRKLDKAEKLGNYLHLNSRLWKLKNLLLVKKGDTVNVALLEDNERLFRQTPQILDARFVLVPVSDKEVDLVIIVQDNWSLQAEIIDNGLSLGERNFLGLHHELINSLSYNQANDFIEYRGLYRVNNIFSSFTNFDFNFSRLIDGDIYRTSLGRTFFAPSVKYAGRVAYTLSEQSNQRFSFQEDTLAIIPNTFEETDIWLGRAFTISKNQRNNLTLGVRFINKAFFNRPQVSEQQNQFFHNRRMYLANLTFSERVYYREALIYAFGRTEDVPQGKNITLTYGWDNYEFGQRFYYGFEAAHGKTFKRLGYFSNRFKAGGFKNQSDWEQIELRFQSSYFSNLAIGKRIGFRQFVNFDYQRGINRFEYETLNANFDRLNYTSLERSFATQRISLELEEVIFKPWNVIGFRTAFFVSALGAFWAKENEDLFQNGLFQAYSLGIRLRNERLSFNNIEIKFTYYPETTYNLPLYLLGFNNSTPLQLKDFDAKAPQSSIWE